MFRRGGLGARLGRARSLKEVFGALVEYPMIGPFLGYQIAIDLNYSEHLLFDEDDFTVPGPGAIRGLQKVFRDLGESDAEPASHADGRAPGAGIRPARPTSSRASSVVGCMPSTVKGSSARPTSTPGRRSRNSRATGSGSSRSIGARQRPLPLFFPPKWNINDRLITVRKTGSPEACEQVEDAQLRLVPVAPSGAETSGAHVREPSRRSTRPRVGLSGRRRVLWAI